MAADLWEGGAWFLLGLLHVFAKVAPSMIASVLVISHFLLTITSHTCARHPFLCFYPGDCWWFGSIFSYFPELPLPNFWYFCWKSANLHPVLSLISCSWFEWGL